MLNKNLALLVLVIFAAGCGIEARTYVITKDRVGLDQSSGNAGCVTGKCTNPAPKETTRKVYVLELTRPVPESEVQKIEETAVNAITATSASPSGENSVSVDNAPAPTDNSQPAAPAQVVVPVIGETPGSAVSPTPEVSNPSTTPEVSNGGNVQAQTYTVQKDDTLQKISKKIFGTYSKWYKIYEANKEKIKNPNVLRTGTVLTIPAIK